MSSETVVKQQLTRAAIAWPDTRNTVTVRQLSYKSPKGLDALKEKTGCVPFRISVAARF